MTAILDNPSPAHHSSKSWAHFPRPKGVFLVKPHRRRRNLDASIPAWTPESSDRILPFAVLEGRKRLANSRFSAQTIKSVKSFLNAVCQANSTIPSITESDEQDVALIHWISGPTSIEVEVGPGGPRYFWARDVDGNVVGLEGEEKKTDIEGLTKKNLNSLSRRASEINPNWRTQYTNR